MLEITRDQACDLIETFAREDRLIQGEWHGRGNDGRVLACALGAIDPTIDSPDECPASVMPEWMAQALVTLFDGVQLERAVHYGLRFAAALRTGNTDSAMMCRWLTRVVEDAARSAAEVSAWAEMTERDAAEEALARVTAAAEIAGEGDDEVVTDAVEEAVRVAVIAARAETYERLFDALIEEMSR